MYEVFYNLKAEPFRLSPDHKFCYEHKGYAKARAYMAYAFKRAEGFVMITGRPGTGKTTLIGELVESLAGDKVRTANLVCTQLQADDLLKTVAFSFGISSKDYDKAELLQRLTTLFQRWHQEGGRALLIVDEAQDLSVSAMEELRLLTNIQIGGQPLVQIFLLGQPELRDLVMAPEMEQVHQRVIAASHLRGLEVDEAEAYVVHRLHAVGWKGDPAIDRAVFPLIHKFSEGVPRRINLICSRLFLLGSVEQRHKIEVVDVRDVIGELQAENLAAGSWFSESDFDLTKEPEWLEVPGANVASGPDPVDQVDDAGSAEAAVTAEGSNDDGETPKKKEDLEAGVAEAGPAEEDVYAADVAFTEPEEPSAALDEPSAAVDNPSATVDVVEELFEVVTSQEYVDAPDDFDELEVTSHDGYEDANEDSERKYFSGNVIAESVLASEEALSDLSSLPDNFIADDDGNPLPEFNPDEAHADPASGELGAFDSADSVVEAVAEDLAQSESQESDDASDGELDAIQRDGKEWPVHARVVDDASASGGRMRTALVALALVALVGASVFFLELYVSQQDVEVGTSLGVDRAAVPAEIASPAAAAAKESADVAQTQRMTGAPGIDAPPPKSVSTGAAEFNGAVSEVEASDESFDPVGPGLGNDLDTTLSGSSVDAVDDKLSSLESDTESPRVDGSSDVDKLSLGEMTEVSAPAAGDEAVVRDLEEASGSERNAVTAPKQDTEEAVRSSNPAQPVVKQVFVVNFDFDSAALGQDANAVLARAVSKLQEFPASTATIAKNADGQTPGASASTMAKARADAVQRFFVSEGVAPARISVQSMNDSQRLASAVPGQDFRRTVQVTVSRMLDG